MLSGRFYYIATLCERTVFSFKGNSWKISGLSAFVANTFSGMGTSSGALISNSVSVLFTQCYFEEQAMLTGAVYLPCS